MTTRADHLRDALAALQPSHLEVHDESHMHSRGLETHYKAVIVSAAFTGKRAIQRHQLVYRTLSEQMQRIHALALHTFTPEEWATEAQVPDSPTCRGGSKHDLKNAPAPEAPSRTA
ncbi:BolA family transcriptional regulator [Luteimonas sp. S4-F44]|uniref:BolA family protein n=1 Tax=Luteimonas sp. S4-F44 TaxID=2925842 RepID=UPI001F535608|nr:BolA family protein [Luteimonas sp. S4-F44]UNK41787.1 BolA family transcriptional regulator [Luteimonas sp. S4-F44]